MNQTIVDEDNVSPPEFGEIGPDANGTATTRSSTTFREIFTGSATLLTFGLVLVVFAIWLGSDFFDVSRRMFDIHRSTPQLLLAVGLVVCLSCHQFDLSVGSMATMSTFITIGFFVRGGLPLPITIALALSVGALGGLINGLLVTRLKINAFIATLGTGGIFAGLAVVYSAGNVIGPNATTEPFPGWFSGQGSLGDFQAKVPLVAGLVVMTLMAGAAALSFAQRFDVSEERRTLRRVILGLGVAIVVMASWAVGIIAAMNWTILLLAALGLLVWTMLKYTVPGRSIYAVGGNVRAAQFAGIRTDAITVLAFIVSGVAAAICGIVLAAVQGSAVPGIADPLLLPAYAAAFLSTVFLSRGRFHVWGTITGGTLLVFVSSGLVLGGVPFTWTQVINGGVLVLTVSLSTYLRRS